MKYGIGLLLFILTLNAFAGTSSVLVLRARVPASYSVVMTTEKGRPVPVIQSNRSRIIPKVSMVRKNNHRLVSVVHP